MIYKLGLVLLSKCGWEFQSLFRSWSWYWDRVIPTFVKSMRPNWQEAAEVSLVRYYGNLKYQETKWPITKKKHILEEDVWDYSQCKEKHDNWS